MSISETMSKTTAAFLMQRHRIRGEFRRHDRRNPVPASGLLAAAVPRRQLLFLVSSTFGLAKVVRDQQEAATVRVRLDEARLEKLLAEHNPLSSVG